MVVVAEAGTHTYSFEGVYRYMDGFGQILQAPFHGSGSITIVDGGRYTVSYDRTTGIFGLVPTP